MTAHSSHDHQVSPDDSTNSSPNSSKSFPHVFMKGCGNVKWKRSRKRKPANAIQPRLTPGTVFPLPFLNEEEKIIMDYCLIEAVVIKYRVRYVEGCYSDWMIGKVEELSEEELLSIEQE